MSNDVFPHHIGEKKMYMEIQNKNIDHGNAFDWGRVSETYGKYRDIYPEEFYKKIVDLGLCTKGKKVLDLGTGTGVLPRNLYQYGAQFVGADISENQIKEAQRLSKENGMDIPYICASAEDIDFPGETFDTVTACQCFMYFNKSIVLPKIHRILKDNGHFAILFMAWLPDESEIARKSENLVLKYNPYWTGANMQRSIPSLPKEGIDLFTVENVIGFDIDIPFTRETWHGRMVACRGIGASSLSAAQIAEFEKEHKAFLNTVPEPFEIPHYVTVLNLRKK